MVYKINRIYTHVMSGCLIVAVHLLCLCLPFATVDSHLVKSDTERWSLFDCYICLRAAYYLLFHLYCIYCWLNFHVWSYERCQKKTHRHTVQVTETSATRWMTVWLLHLKLVTSEWVFIWILLPAVSHTGEILLNCSNRSVNIMGIATETWNVALITTLIYRGQSLSACERNLTFPFAAHDFLFDLVYTIIKPMSILYYIWYNMFV